MIKKLLLIIILLSVAILHIFITRRKVYIEQIDEYKKYSARIEWKRVFPYIQGVNAYLVVENISNKKVVIDKILLQDRDVFEDIKFEIIGIKWEGDYIKLILNRGHYNGPAIFLVK